ncbi:MAG: hypothetical protein V7752_18835 [Halopseudomonas sp.]
METETVAKLSFVPGEVVQGTVTIQPVNLMLVFQVNCPGCLLYALPQLQQLTDRFPYLNGFALSTAFEDFALNNQLNTLALCNERVLVGASMQHYARLGQHMLPYRISVPVLMDWFLPATNVSEIPQRLLQAMEQESLSPAMVEQIRDKLGRYLDPVLHSGRTFLNNQFQGTPSWVLFDDQFEIKNQWFGIKEFEQVCADIERYHPLEPS